MTAKSVRGGKCKSNTNISLSDCRKYEIETKTATRYNSEDGRLYGRLNYIPNKQDNFIKSYFH